MIEKFEKKVIKAICENDLVYLLKNLDDIDINMRLKSEDNDTLLMYSISDSDSNVYKHFIDKGADLNLDNDLGENILHSAIYSGQPERVMEAFALERLNKQSIEGTTPLLLSVGLEEEVIANFLIDKGADINCGDNDGNKPIHLASYFGLTSVVKKLIIHRADIHAKTKKGNLTLALAVNEGHKEIIEMLYRLMYPPLS